MITTVFVILFSMSPSTPPPLLENSAYPTRGSCEQEVIRMRRLAMSLKLTPADCWCQQLVERK
jgi:hypothetical protein